MDVLQNDHPWLTLLVLGEVPSLRCSTPDLLFQWHLQGVLDFTSNTKLTVFWHRGVSPVVFTLWTDDSTSHAKN